MNTTKQNILFKNKSKLNDAVCSSIIYRYDCDTCQKVYVGATNRHFEKRLSEHMKGENNSEIGFQSHAPKKSNFKIVC